MVGQKLVIPGKGAAAIGGVKDVLVRDHYWPIALSGSEARGHADKPQAEGLRANGASTKKERL